MKFKRSWLLILIVVALVAAGGYYVANRSPLTEQAQNVAGTTQMLAAGEDAPQTVQIQPAEAIIDEVQAAGAIELSGEHYVALEVDGAVDSVQVSVGDVVTAGQTLVTLNTVELERALRRAELTVQTQMNSQAQLTEPVSADEIAAAEATLAAAQAELADVKVGPSAQEIAAARSSAASSWAAYNELQAGPSEAEQTQLIADLKRKEVALAEAQRSYDKVAWTNEVGMTSQSADLQDATISYEEAKAAYAESTAAATTSSMQSTLSAAQDAQEKLDDLLAQPAVATIASAESSVASAQSNLAQLKTGATRLEVQAAQLSLESALVDLEEAHANLAKATVVAPVAGTVLSVAAEIGQRANRGEIVVTLADTTQLQLTINVADVDISQVSVGQAATVEIDAFADESFAGEVAYITPASDSTSGVVNYPVTIRLTDTALTGVRPGMKAVATLADTNATVTAQSWLVPTSALQQTGDATTVSVVRNGVATPFEVVP
ncbi:MAG: efflux RND transporter periplasmic adaptor subunit, partial [Chloroflexota bacterium]|nr:efflux RND transporter periplasmic adaptor subunit [Chloroflexota bacterium]